MFDRLAFVLAPLTVLCIAGAVVIAGMAMGYYAWPLYLVAGLVGLACGLPTAYWSSKRIKRKDPNWPRHRS
ncbi:hypothetical protein ACP2AV_13730 [Aliiroseovarius sp. PTFE2010]|uniref:hypothetical protein n=1 Tax=Aliiroseovarius sp. PTFE2010 TaxID=3417190 RepID=UPI003CEABDF2